MPQAQALLPDLLPADDAATPLMAQYLAQKAQHQDCLLFFRLGDFYELFFEDAIKASSALDIALTKRGQHKGEDVPMCGVPAHSYENYLARLIKLGFRVALCDQMESPEDAKKRGGKSIVKREVVRIVTPGTVTEESLLDARASNYLVCLAAQGDDLALGWVDLASGKPYAQELIANELSGALARLDGAEILISERLLMRPDVAVALEPYRARLAVLPQGRFDGENARRRLLTIYNVAELAPFGEFSRAEVTALGALLDYAQLTQKSDLKHLSPPQKTGSAQNLSIDPATRRNLELTRTLAGEKTGTLLHAIDRTLTGAGARMLASRLVAPLTDVASITTRLDAVELLKKMDDLRGKLREALRQTPDLERALARLALGRGGPRDLASIRDALKSAEQIRRALLPIANKSQEIAEQTQALGEHNTIADKLDAALAPELPFLARDGNFIAKGFSAQLDELVTLRDDSRRIIATLQQNYSNRANVPALKIRHNNVIGYHIEVTPLHADKILAQKDIFIHRQTLATSARFTTVELGELERKINEAADKALAVELQIFDALVKDVVVNAPELRRAAEALAVCDVTAALAELAGEQNYVRPIVDNTLAFDVKGGRHPVVEQALKSSGVSFVANDCDLGADARLWLLTGPNMAGKSTFLRQNALIVLMAQMGSFVPAVSAHIGVVDKLFSRVGAADDLARGRSTFMVEMVETAAILNQASEKALVILDEIGRGTATYDGLSIAWATLEHLHEANKCRALFATHYHELTSLAGKLPALSCYTMRIKEWQGDIVFLHEVAEGVADRSYGIHVAMMAGLPKSVIARAEKVLATLEADRGKSKGGELANALPKFETIAPREYARAVSADLEKILLSLQPDELSPKEALEMIYIIKSNIKP